MAGSQLYGWDATGEQWIKLVCNAEGKLIIDPSEIFENDPTDNEHGKAPDSDWAFDHKADTAAHHAKYTDADSRAATNDIFGADGKADKTIDLDNNLLIEIKQIRIRSFTGGSRQLFIFYWQGTADVRFQVYDDVTGFQACNLMLYNGASFDKVAIEPVVDTKILTHKNIAAAHHAKYTDLEAQTACKLNGTVYMSHPGNSFFASHPDIDDVEYNIYGEAVITTGPVDLNCGFQLPHGATVTGVIVNGNGGAAGETYYLKRMTLIGGTTTIMGQANVNTEDTSISNAVIDNSTYVYFVCVLALDSTDIITGLRISYTL